MRISTKGEYGLLALLDVALQPHGAPVQVAQIARRQRIPKQYLDQLMLSLKRAGLVASVRGRQGGYRLARPAASITLLDAIAALEGPQENVNFTEPSRRHHGARVVLRGVWEKLSNQSIKLLKSKSLAEICAECEEGSASFIYEI